MTDSYSEMPNEIFLEPNEDGYCDIRHGAKEGRTRYVRADLPPPSAEIPETVIGVGDGSGNLFVRGSYEAIKRVQQFIFDAEKYRASTTAAVTEGDARHEFEKLLFDMEVKNGPVFKDSLKQVETIRILLQQASGARGWNFDMAAAPDGESVMVISRVKFVDDRWFEPEKAYRNGEVWFSSPGERLFSKPDAWQSLPEPPAKKEGE